VLEDIPPGARRVVARLPGVKPAFAHCQEAAIGLEYGYGERAGSFLIPHHDNKEGFELT
jgi:hypothetical protein